MKKLICFLLVAAAAFAMCGCGGGENGESGAVTSEFYIESDGGDIYCKSYISKDADGELPAVILSHSAALTGDSLKEYAEGFASRGFYALTFDFKGGSADSRSDGEERDMTVFTEVADLMAVIYEVSRTENVKANEIYLFGTSQGGLVSALAADDCAQNGTEIAGLILLYPAFNIADLVKNFAENNGGNNGGFDFSGMAERFGFPMPDYGEDYISSLLNFDVFANINAYTGKALILHGSLDFIVPVSYSQTAAQIYGDNCELHVINGAMHGFNADNFSFTGDFDGEVWEYIDGFLG